MKKILTLIALAGLLVTAARAEQPRKFSFGMKAGYNSGQLRKAGEDQGGFQVEKFALGGFSIGIFGNLRLNRMFSLQAELLYFAKGGGYDVQVPVTIPGVSIQVKDERRLTYVEIPVTLKFRPPFRWPVLPTFYAGLSAAVNTQGELKSRIHVVTPAFPVDFIEEKDLRSELNDVEFSGVIGGGLDIPVGGATFHLDNRFFFGFKANKFTIVVPMSKFVAMGFPAGPDQVYALDMMNYVTTFTVGVSY